MIRSVWFVLSVIYVMKCSAMSAGELEDFSNFLKKTSQLDLNVKSAHPEDEVDEDEEVSDHAWEESGKFEGDLILNDRQRRLIVENVEGLSRNGLTDSTKRWPNNEVIYYIQKEHFSIGQMQAIQDGIDDLARASCVKFRPYQKGDTDAVVIQGSRRGCFSQVGYQGGYQVLNLFGRHPVGRGCFRHGTVVHELLHTLGFYHMQSSHDRDDYIDVVWANILQPARHNFRKYNSFAVSDFGVGYDYDSVLHYSRRAFSANGQDTLVPKKNGAQIGQRVGLSDKDTQKLNKMYCDADSGNFQADENTSNKSKNKKKKPKNPPFDGHGIGYHQGKTVIIKLPAVETEKLSNVPSIDVFDFSRTPQAVSTPESKDFQFTEKVKYNYNKSDLHNKQSRNDYTSNNHSFEVDNSQKIQNGDRVSQSQRKVANTKDNDEQSSNKTHIDTKLKEKESTDDASLEDLINTYKRISKTVQSHIYPQRKSLNYDKNLSQFFQLFESEDPPKSSDTSDEQLEKPLSYVAAKPKKQIDVNHDEDKNLHKKLMTVPQEQFLKKMDDVYDDDDTYRTRLPVNKPYSAYEQTETPYYATLDYLKDRNNYSRLYSTKLVDDKNLKEPYTILGHQPPTEEEWYKNDYYKVNPANYDRESYTDYVKNENDDINDSSTKQNYDTNSPLIKVVYHSDHTPFYGENKNQRDHHSRYYDQDNPITESQHSIKYNSEFNSDYRTNKKDEERLSGRSLKYYDESPYYQRNPDADIYDYDGNNDSNGDINSDSTDSNENDTKPTKKMEAYTLLGAKVPFTQNWFTPDSSTTNYAQDHNPE